MIGSLAFHVDSASESTKVVRVLDLKMQNSGTILVWFFTRPLFFWLVSASTLASLLPRLCVWFLFNRGMQQKNISHLPVCPRETKSCFAAEVPVQGDEANDKGRAVLAKLCARDRVLVCGQASSHCVNFSARDLAAAWKRTTTGALEDEIARRRMGSLVLLKDGMSPVPGFEVGGQNCFSSCESHFMILWLTSFISLPLMLVGLSSETRMAPTRTHNTHARE